MVADLPDAVDIGVACGILICDDHIQIHLMVSYKIDPLPGTLFRFWIEIFCTESFPGLLTALLCMMREKPVKPNVLSIDDMRQLGKNGFLFVKWFLFHIETFYVTRRPEIKLK